MDTKKTLCPSCGANITNHQNCEFCGSLLVRLMDKGIDLQNSDYHDDSKVFPGLVSALKQNLELQKATNHKLAVVTDVINYAVKQKDVAGILNNFALSEIDGKSHLKVCFVYIPADTESGDDLLLQKFRKLDIFELFTGHIEILDDGVRGYEYEIDFGEDAEGAARLLSKVFHEVYGLAYGTHLDYYTNSGDDIDKCRAQYNGVWYEQAWFLQWGRWVLFAVAFAAAIFLFDLY